MSDGLLEADISIKVISKPKAVFVGLACRCLMWTLYGAVDGGRGNAMSRVYSSRRSDIQDQCCRTADVQAIKPTSLTVFNEQLVSSSLSFPFLLFSLASPCFRWSSAASLGCNLLSAIRPGQREQDT